MKKKEIFDAMCEYAEIMWGARPEEIAAFPKSPGKVRYPFIAWTSEGDDGKEYRTLSLRDGMIHETKFSVFTIESLLSWKNS